jgi:hypothetical protein
MSSLISGRDAAIARRLALSAGKAALPPAQERTRSGFRDARPAEAAAAPPPPQAAAPAPALPVTTGHAISGRTASIARRRMQAGGKAALQAPAPLAAPAPAPRAGTLEYAHKVVTSTTQHGLQVTGSRMGRGQQVTGDERGTLMPVSGTQYIDAETGGAWRASGTKVGQARTEAGLTVTGTLVRSAVRITGDERGERSTITGKVDQRPADDLTARPSEGAAVSAQFQRQVNPHGGGALTGNLGRSARGVGSRQRGDAPVIEATEAGAAITGSAIGRSLRVTGDEHGACRPISGSQYLAPARREVACGGQGGGTAPAALIGTDRADPVTLSKVAVSETWGGQRVTGIDVAHHKSVTGDAPGTCAALTGSQYQAPPTVCGDPGAKSANARRLQARGRLPVTGDTPVRAQAVSGLDRGATRDISGTVYYGEAPQAAVQPDPVGTLDARFSIRSPQRAAQLSARPVEADGSRITGSFAVGGGKVTGNVEFTARSRVRAANDKPAHTKVSGEGSGTGPAITGGSWAQHANVTGTDGAFAATRNPSERGPKAQAFSGNAYFKTQAKQSSSGEPRELVTGMSGSFSKSGARVTLSGGAQS